VVVHALGSASEVTSIPSPYAHIAETSRFSRESPLTFGIPPDRAAVGRYGRGRGSTVGPARGETTVDLWTEAFEEMNAIDPKQLNLEQRLRRAEVKALLVIAQELVALRERGSANAG
jgi:hypothetical protein